MYVNNGDVVGTYCIQHDISAGGMSHIFLATLLDRPNFRAALKFNGSAHPRYQDLLRHEAEILAQLRHPNIVRIFPMRLERKTYYTARAQDIPHRPWYFAMEYLEGGSLDQHVAQIAGFPLAWRVELFYQLLITVHFIHQNGLAHLDLKPENIVLRHFPRPDQGPQPTIIDFGSASLLERRARLSFSVHYSPPEIILAQRRQKEGKTPCLETLRPEKTDVWALGAILFELLTGMPLVPEAGGDGAMRRILDGNWPSVRASRPEIDESFDLMLAVMLHPEPQARPTLDELLVAIEEKIVSVCPPRIPFSEAPASGSAGIGGR